MGSVSLLFRLVVGSAGNKSASLLTLLPVKKYSDLNFMSLRKEDSRW